MNQHESKDWYEEEELWDYFLPILVERAGPMEVANQVDDILRRLAIPDGGSVLDLGCGIGRHVLELGRRGYHVVGVDRTARYLEIARARAQSERLSTELLREDMRTFHRRNAFDGVISIFTSFGYFDSAEQDQQVVRNVFDSLRPGGAFLVDVQGKENVARTFRKRDWRPIQMEGRDILLLEERELLPAWTGVRSRWIFIEEDRRADFTMTVRLYSATELVALLKECGFGAVDIFGGLDGAPYDQNASRLVAVARK